MGKKIMENTFTLHLLSADKNKADTQGAANVPLDNPPLLLRNIAMNYGPFDC